MNKTNHEAEGENLDMVPAENLEKRDRFRKRCQPRPIDLCTLGERVHFFQMTVVDESKEGLGCMIKDITEMPNVGTELDWCGLKRYEVRWTKKEKTGHARVGLKLSS